MSELVTIHRQGTPTGSADAQGNPLLTPTTDIPIMATAVAPMQGSETAENTGSRSVDGFTLYLPIGTDIRSTDFLTIRGTSGWHVEADASQADWVSPFTSWAPGTVAIVRRAS